MTTGRTITEEAASIPEAACAVACDTCSNVFHLQCSGLTEVPGDDEEWSCPRCVAPAKELARRKAELEGLSVDELRQRLGELAAGSVILIVAQANDRLLECLR